MAGFMMATMAVKENEKFKQHNNIQQQNEATINVNQNFRIVDLHFIQFHSFWVSFYFFGNIIRKLYKK